MAIVGAIYHEYKLSVTDLVFYSATEESIVQSESDTEDAVLIGFTIILTPNDKNLEIQRFEYGEDPERAAFNSSQNPDDISSEADRRLAREYTNDFIAVYGDSRVIGVEAVYNDRVNALRKRLNTFGLPLMSEEHGERIWYPPTTFPVINYVMPGSEYDYYKSNIEDYNEDPALLAEDYFYYPDESYKLDRYVQGEFVPNYDAVLPRPNEYLDIIRDGFKKVPLNQIREVGIPAEGSDNFIITETGGIRLIDPDAEVSTTANTNQTNINENPNAISQERPTPPEPEDVVQEIINPPSQITTENNIRETIDNNPTRIIPNIESQTGRKRRRKEADPETVNRRRQQQQADENTTASTNIVKKKIKGRVIDSKTLKPIPASIVYTLEIVKELTVSGGEENELENLNQVAAAQQGTFNTRITLQLIRPRTVNESGLTDEEEVFAQSTGFLGRRSNGTRGDVYIIDNNNKIIMTIMSDFEGRIDKVINLPINLNTENSNFTNYRILFRSPFTKTKFQYIKYTNPNEVPTIPTINDLNLGEISLPEVNSNVQSYTRDTPNGERESTIFDFLSLPEVTATPSGLNIRTENSEIVDGAPIPLEELAESQEIVDPDEIPNFKGADSGTFAIDTNKKGRFTIKFGTSYSSMPNTITVSKAGYMTKSVRILQKDGLKKLNLGDIPLVSNDIDLQEEIEQVKLDLSPSQVLDKIPNLNTQPLDVTKAKLRAQFFETTIKTLLPVVLSLLASFGMSKINEILSGKLDKNKKCPSPEKLDEIVKRRNNLADKLNSIYVTIQAATVALGIAQTLISTIKSLLELAKKVPIPLGAPIGVGVPANVVTELSSGIEDKKKQVEFFSNLTTGILLFLTLIGVVLKTILDLLSKVDELVERCSKDKALTPINPDLLKLTNQPQVPEQQIQEADFTFKIETENTTSNFKRRRAIAIDKNGVTVLKGEFSYSADTKILIDELKFYIQENDLKAE